jgi:arylsulfatase A-like enzyme
MFTVPRLRAIFGVLLAASLLLCVSSSQAQNRKTNIVFIMGDDVGWSNIGVYNQGIMAGRTPNLDKLASQGMRFTDYYAEASCTAGRANFITGELPIRTGLTTVGQAGSPLGMPAEAPTIATVLKSMGYATGQFGKNHLGDLNQFLPTAHGLTSSTVTFTILTRWRIPAIPTTLQR